MKRFVLFALLLQTSPVWAAKSQKTDKKALPPITVQATEKAISTQEENLDMYSQAADVPLDNVESLKDVPEDEILDLE